MSSVSMHKFDLEALHWRSSTDRQSTWPRVIFGLFGDIFTLNSYTESQIILWLVYIIHIYVLCKHAQIWPWSSSFKVIHLLPNYLTEGHFWSSICLFVCEQDNSKTDRWILMKFSGYVQNGKRKIWLNFGSYPDHCLDLLDPWNLIFKDR